MVIDKNTFNFIGEMINNKESLQALKSFCKGYGMDIANYSSPVYVSSDKIVVTYRRNNYYISYIDSKVYGTVYYGKLK